eukprot:jgi/Botrbrau1/7599/Bobra.0159s0048.1
MRGAGLPNDVVEHVSKQFQCIQELSPQLLFVNRSWKDNLLPLLRSRKGWGQLQWVFYQLSSLGLSPVDCCIHRPCGQSCLFRNLTETAVSSTNEGLCYVEYACEGQGDTMCVFVTGSNLEKAKAKTAEVVGVFEAEGTEVTWPSGTEFEGPFFVTLEAADKDFLKKWKQKAGNERRSPCRSRPVGQAGDLNRRSPERCFQRKSMGPAHTPSPFRRRSFLSPNRCPHCSGEL